MNSARWRQFLHRLRLVAGLQRLQRGLDLTRALPKLVGERRPSIGVEDGPVCGLHRQPSAGLRRDEPGLEGAGLRRQPQGQEEPRGILHQRGVGDAEVDEVLRHLDGRGGHCVAIELLRPQEVGAFEQATILGRALLPETELGLLDRVLEVAFLDQTLDLLAERRARERWSLRNLLLVSRGHGCNQVSEGRASPRGNLL